MFCYFVYFCFLNAVWALTSGCFRIVSDAFVFINAFCTRRRFMQTAFIFECRLLFKFHYCTYTNDNVYFVRVSTATVNSLISLKMLWQNTTLI